MVAKRFVEFSSARVGGSQTRPYTAAIEIKALPYSADGSSTKVASASTALSVASVTGTSANIPNILPIKLPGRL
jgi:hypothetical protein